MQMIAGVAPIIGGLISATGLIDAGNEGYSDSVYEAVQLRENAKKAMVKSSVDIENKDREFEYLASRALAVSGNSGGSVSDPTIQKILADIHGEGAYEKSKLLYGGREEESKYNQAADAKLMSGKRLKSASRYKAFSSVLSGVGDGATGWFGAGRFVNTQLAGTGAGIGV